MEAKKREREWKKKAKREEKERRGSERKQRQDSPETLGDQELILNTAQNAEENRNDRRGIVEGAGENRVDSHDLFVETRSLERL
jgi:hypothetical protein